MDQQQIISALTEKLKNNPYMLGLLLVGSHARKTIYKNTPYSDIEVYVIVKDEDAKKFESELPKIVKPLGKVIFSYKNQWAGFSTVFENLLRLELPVVKISEIPSVFSRPTAQDVEILIDKTNGIIKKTLDNRPKTIDFEKVFINTTNDFWYMAVVAIQYYKKGEFWNARHAQEVSMIPSLIKFIEMLENPDLLLLESNKRIEQLISSKDITILKDVCPPYEKEKIKKCLQKNIEEFSKLSAIISKKFNYKYPVDMENKIASQLENLLDN